MNADHCPVCFTRYHQKGNNVFLRCSSCKALIRTKIDHQRLDDQYKSAWEDPFRNLKHTGATDTELARNYLVELKKSLNISSFSNMRILDFGAGRGTLCKELMDQGAEVIAVEPYGYEMLTQNGINAYHSLDEITALDMVDGVLCVDVIEHITNPNIILEQLKEKLKTKGWLYISTPNSSSLNARITKKNWREAQNPGHLVLYNPECLTRAIRMAGFSSWARQKWNIVYNKNLLFKIKDWTLLTLKLDGELRYMAIN